MFRYRKIDKTIHGNSACIQPPFSFLGYRTQLSRKQSEPFEITWNFGAKTTLEFYIYFLFVHNFCLWRTWEYIRTGILYIFICVPHVVQADRNIDIHKILKAYVYNHFTWCVACLLLVFSHICIYVCTWNGRRVLWILMSMLWMWHFWDFGLSLSSLLQIRQLLTFYLGQD
jgi:hypothetical protein